MGLLHKKNLIKRKSNYWGFDEEIIDRNIVYVKNVKGNISSSKLR